MSDSDDTDVLLLIPPDFFFVAPSPSPASSPLTVTPPSPIDHSLYRDKKITLTEQQAANSLKEITSQLRLIDERLSAVESQRSGSMDDENSSVWYDLQSFEMENSGCQPRKSSDRCRQSMNVRELLHASVKDTAGLSHPREGSLTHSWEQSSLKHPYNQYPKQFIQQRDSTSRVLLQEGNDFGGDEVLRERRASSLPPTPSRHSYQSPPTKQANLQPYSSNQKERKDQLWKEAMATTSSLGRKSYELEHDKYREIEFANRYDKHSEEITGRSARETGKKSNQFEQREIVSKKVDDQKVYHAPDDGQSFQSNSLDGTLGISEPLPSLSMLGLSSSHVFPTSLEETRATDCSIEGGFTLSQVEKLLQDMQKTQAEMEKSMRGMKNLRRDGKEETVGHKIVSDLEGREPRNGRDSQGPEADKSTFKSEGNKVDHGQNNKRDPSTNRDTQGFPLKSSTAPVSIVVESGKVGEYRWRDCEEMECSDANRKGYPLYKSKSDESISGSKRDIGNNKCVGTESGDDCFINSGRLTPSHISRLGDTIGSVPDLGLGVREMFAKMSEKHHKHLKDPSKGLEEPQESVTEPPFVKKKMSLLESENPDAKITKNGSVSIAENNKCVGTESDDESFINRGRLTPTNISRVGDTIGSVPDLGLGVREMFAKTPEKHQDPVKDPSKGSEKSQDAVKEPPFSKKKTWLVGSGNVPKMENRLVSSAENNKCVGTESDDESFINMGRLTPTNISRLGDTIGSVPDLGLGVREMFDKTPEKHQDPVKDPSKGSEKSQDAAKEPPFSKKKTWLVGSGNVPRMENRLVSTAENNKCVGTESDDDSCINSDRLTSSHISYLGDTLGSVPDLGLGVREMFAKTPEKYQDPVKGPSKGSKKSRAAIKEPPFVKKKTWLLGSNNCDAQILENSSVSTAERIPNLPAPSSLRHEKNREDTECNRDNDRGEGEHFGRRFQKHREEMMGPMIVVGGDGSRKVRRELSKGWEGEGTGFKEGRRYGSGERRGDEEEEMGTMKRDAEDRPKRRVYIDSREGRDQEKYGQGSLDSRRDKYARFRDSGYGDSAKSSYGGIHQMHAQRLYHTSGAWAVPLPSDIDTTAGPEVIIGLRRKLEEEKFRREHCEQVIEEVGRRALETQERLAVCEGMSKAKDVALVKFHDAWEEAVSGWKKEGEACKDLEKEIDRYRKRMNEELTFRDKRLKQLEGEVVHLGEESHFLREELRKGQRETADITARLSTMLEAATKEVANCRKDAESALMKEARAKEEASKACEASREAKEKMNEAVKKAEFLESEKNMMKQELETSQGKMKDCISRISTLEKQLADAEIVTDKAKNNEKSLVENFSLAQKEWEKERMKLKDFYQSQVEELVKTKVNEFQSQLDTVEISLRKEAEIREQEAKKLGEERLRMLNEKHSQEVSLLEQKHGEEISLWNLRLKRTMEEIDSLKHEISKHNSQKSQLAKGLHTLMQAQLRQGLRLIASGGEVDQDAVLTPPKKIEKGTLETSWREMMSSFNIPDKTDVLPEKEYHSKKVANYSREKGLHSKERTDNVPILSEQNKISVDPNSELRKYIHMLLGQEPGKPLGIQDISSESEGDYEKHILESKGKQYLTKQMSKLGIGSEEPKLAVRDKRRSRKERRKAAEKEDACKLTKDVPMSSWSTVGLTLEQPTTVAGILEEYPNAHENRRMRKPPWK